MRKRVASSGRNGRCGVGRRSRTASARSRHSWRHSRSGTPAQGSHDLENYDTALATVQVGRADGISYILTPEDPFAAIDLDHCRELDTQSIDIWAQNFLHRGGFSYSEGVAGAFSLA